MLLLTFAFHERGFARRHGLREMDLSIFGFFQAALAISANEMEIISLSLLLCDTKASGMLPNIALFASNAMSAVILLRVSTYQDDVGWI